MGLRRTCLLLLIAALPSLAFGATTHTVKKKESLNTLAKKYHVTVADLKAANNIVNSRLKPGSKLVIPPRKGTADDDRRKEEQSTAGTHRVKKGETLTMIAKRTGVSLKELKRLNGLRGNRVKPGQVLSLKRSEDEPRAASTTRRPLIHTELFSEEEYERTLAELTDSETEKGVDFSKNVELGNKEEATSLLKKRAYSFLGTRYRFGGSSRSGIDCSSFVQQVFRGMDVNLPRTAREQFQVGDVVSPADLQKGDLVFFQTYARFASHVGIYLGGNKMIHASSRDRRVVISTMKTPYYLSRFLGAKRISKINPDIFNFSDLFAGVEEEREEDIFLNDTLGVNTETVAN